jgi:hypothetical protein
VERKRLEDRAQEVVAVGANAEDTEAQVDLRVRAETDNSHLLICRSVDLLI